VALDIDIGDDTESVELDNLLGETLGLTPRQARRLRRALARMPGHAVAYPGGATARDPIADLNRVAMQHPDLVALVPSGWGLDALRAALERAVGQGAYTLTARASFAGLTANETATATLESPNAVFLAYKLCWSPSNTALERQYIGRMRQQQKYDRSDERQSVRLSILLGPRDQAHDQVASRFAIVGPQSNSWDVLVTCEGAGPGVAHSIDFAYHGYMLTTV
jgi:hypothetical protein